MISMDPLENTHVMLLVFRVVVNTVVNTLVVSQNIFLCGVYGVILAIEISWPCGFRGGCGEYNGSFLKNPFM